jgi:DNA-3-methyladenine glycosylase II
VQPATQGGGERREFSKVKLAAARIADYVEPRACFTRDSIVRKTAFSTAAAEVARRDRVMANLMKRTAPFRLPRRSTGHFAALAESILHQQLAGAAARAIHGRFVGLFDGDLSPEAVLAVPPRKLRTAGLSGRKVASIRDLAAKVVDGTVPLHRVGRLADEDVITRLSVVRGIGRWTAEMFLIFQLRRLDVWPVGDYGVRKGYALAYGLRKLPTPKQLEREGERFRPYRTVAAWYCWQAVRAQRKLRQ